MIIGILKEPASETRVSLLPEAAAFLTKLNVTVQLENNAGAFAYASDASYQTKNTTAAERSIILSTADIVLSINPLSEQDIQQLKPSAVLVGVYQPLINYTLMKQWINFGSP